MQSIAVAGTTAGQEITEDHPDPDADGDGLIRMLTHGFVGGFRAFDRFVTDTARDFLGAIQRGGKTFAGFRDFFSGHVSGGGHQGARIFGQLARLMTGFMCMFAHIFGAFCLFAFFNGSIEFGAHLSFRVS
jgi:hypothetical protein